jgi:adenosylcobinamide-phosphate synthase
VPDTFALAALVLLIESLIGYPKPLQTALGHPVEWIGKLISKLDEQLNEGANRKQKGVIAILLLCAAAGIPAAVLTYALSQIPYGWVLNVLLATSLVAQHSMREHIRAVADALDISLVRARTEVGKIVGRDPDTLDESGISKAALESLAENTSDGIVAPIFWYALAGLPGIAIYKAINTADSMIGHKSERYLEFGWAAAKLDDLVNLPASRLTGALFTATAWLRSKQQAKAAWNAMRRDASKHNSPNAGWPEASMAGALGLRFGGPRSYGGDTLELPWMGDGRAQMTKEDIRSGLAFYEVAILVLAAGFAVLAIVL